MQDHLVFPGIICSFRNRIGDRKKQVTQTLARQNYILFTEWKKWGVWVEKI